MQPQDTWTSQSASVSLNFLAGRTNQGFLKNEVLQFWPCLFSFRRCHLRLQSCLMRAAGQILRKKAEQNHQQMWSCRIAFFYKCIFSTKLISDWLCNFQSQHTHQLGCICQSISRRQWKGEVTKLRTLTGVQRPHRTALIACHLSEHKPPVGNRMT